MAGASIPPWTTSISSRPPRPYLPKTTFHQVPSPSKDTLPLPPDDSAQPTAQPTSQVLKNPLHLRKTEVITPPTKKWSQALNEPLQIPAPTHSKCTLELRPKTTHRLRSHPQTWQLIPRHRVTQKRPVPRPVNRRFLLIDLQPQPLWPCPVPVDHSLAPAVGGREGWVHGSEVFGGVQAGRGQVVPRVGVGVPADRCGLRDQRLRLEAVGAARG